MNSSVEEGSYLFFTQQRHFEKTGDGNAKLLRGVSGMNAGRAYKKFWKTVLLSAHWAEIKNK